MNVSPLLYTLEPSERPSPNESYGSLRGPLPAERLPKHIVKGGLIIVRPHPDSTWPTLAEQIEFTATRVVNAPLALWPDCVGRRRGVEFAARARGLGVRAVIWKSDPLTDSLRPMLTDPGDWPDVVCHWLRRRGIDRSSDVVELLRNLAASASAHRTFAALTAALDSHSRAWYHTFSAARLGPPGAWHSLLRAVRIGLAIQQAPDRRLAELAFDFGFSSASSLSDRLNEVIGARPRFIRHRLGTQWMLADAVRRSKILQPSVGP